jgi:hypothetical protein
METVLRVLFTHSGDAAALYIYRRLVRGQIAAMGMDPAMVAVVAQDFINWGSSSTEEGQALEQVVMDQVGLASATLTVADMALFIQKLGNEIAADYPPAA